MFRFIYFLGNFFKFSKSQHFTNILTRIDPEKLLRMRFVFTVFRQFTKQNFEPWKYRKCRQLWGLRPLHKSFPLNISSVNVTKSAVIPDLRNPTYFVRFNEEILMENFFFCAVIFWSLCLINTLNAENVNFAWLT